MSSLNPQSPDFRRWADKYIQLGTVSTNRRKKMKYAIETLEIERARLIKVIRELEESPTTTLPDGSVFSTVDQQIKRSKNLKTIEEAIELLKGNA